MLFSTVVYGSSASVIFKNACILAPARACHISVLRAQKVASLVHLSPSVILQYHITKFQFVVQGTMDYLPRSRFPSETEGDAIPNSQTYRNQNVEGVNTVNEGDKDKK